MNLIFNPDVFALGLAVGVLGLVLLLSLIIAYAYEERTLLFLAAYVAVLVGLIFTGEQLLAGREGMQIQLLVAGPALVTILVMWLLRNRHSSKVDKTVMVAIGLVTVALMVFYGVTGMAPSIDSDNGKLALGLALAWLVLLVGSSFYLGIESWDSAGPWKWWLVIGDAAGLVVALVFLGDLVDAERAYWPVVLMLVLQVPPIYLSLVWRSRLLNESRLRSAAAAVTDPLTGLATTPVLVERLMRITSRANQSKIGQSNSALFLIQVQNWNGLLAELGAEFNEKLLLEAALRVRRSIGDNDLVARISGGRFAVVAQGLLGTPEISSMATRLVVSGLRIDSPQLPGVELQFRVILRPLSFAKPMPPAAVREWLDSLASRFDEWPSTHRARSILVVEGDVSKPVTS
ncbi:MAG: diguanylate cyclase [Pseudomonadota bacterium]